MRFSSDQEYDAIDSMAHQEGVLGSKVHHHRAVRNSTILFGFYMRFKSDQEYDIIDSMAGGTWFEGTPPQSCSKFFGF